MSRRLHHFRKDLLGLNDAVDGVIKFDDYFEVGSDELMLALDVFPKIHGFFSLSYHMSDDEASCLSRAVERSSMLRELSLSLKGFTSQGLHDLADAFTENKSLHKIALKYSKDLAGQAERLLPVLFAHNIEHLDLAVNQLTCSSLVPLELPIKTKNMALKELRLPHNYIRDRGATALAHALRYNLAALTLLDLGHNYIADEGATALSEVLRQNQTLQELNLQGNQIAVEGASSLAAILHESSSLMTVNLARNTIGSAGTIHIASTIGDSVLKHLNLGFNQIESGAAVHLGEALQRNSALEVLDLSGNYIGDAGASAFAALLKCSESKIVELNLHSTNITTVGVRQLAEALAENACLRKLDLSKNWLGNSGAAVLTDMLKVNETLTKISLNGTHMRSQGLLDLCDGLRVNTALSCLELWDNEIGATSIAALRTVLKETNITLQDVMLDYRCFCCDDAVFLYTKENKHIQSKELFVQACNIAEGVLPKVLAKTDRLAVMFHCLRTRVDIVVQGLRSR